ncbi:MAG TPA: hypothetical protein VIA18_30860 [Polyangia bacterium]|jgi:hypothetical protein|nr:hypothetical protein [Polyangia bacterium]
MRTWLMTVAVGASLVGCATTSSKHDASARRAHPSESDDSSSTATASAKAPLLGGSSLKILAKRPTAKQYKFVGRVEATSTSNDIVADAVKADEALQRQAAALGANAVALDVIDPPRDGSKARRHVILAGRAYREVKTN